MNFARIVREAFKNKTNWSNRCDLTESSILHFKCQRQNFVSDFIHTYINTIQSTNMIQYNDL